MGTKDATVTMDLVDDHIAQTRKKTGPGCVMGQDAGVEHIGIGQKHATALPGSSSGISRGIAIPIYLTQLNFIDFIDPSYLPHLNTISKSFLYISGLSGTSVIIFFVIKAFIRKKRVYATIVKKA